MRQSTLDTLMYRRVRGKAPLTLEQGRCLEAFARDWRTIKNKTLGAPHAEDRIADATDRIMRAQERLGPTMFALVSRIAGMDLGLEETEKKMELPARSAKIVIAIAADQLIHFGIYTK